MKKNVKSGSTENWNKKSYKHTALECDERNARRWKTWWGKYALWIVKRKCLGVYTQHIAHACSRQPSPLQPQKTWIKLQKINEFCRTWHRFIFLAISFSATFGSSVLFLFYVLLLPFAVVDPAETLIILNVSQFHCGIYATSTPVGFLLVFISTAPIIQRQFFLRSNLSTRTQAHSTRRTHINSQREM